MNAWTPKLSSPFFLLSRHHHLFWYCAYETSKTWEIIGSLTPNWIISASVSTTFPMNPAYPCRTVGFVFLLFFSMSLPMMITMLKVTYLTFIHPSVTKTSVCFGRTKQQPPGAKIWSQRAAPDISDGVEEWIAFNVCIWVLFVCIA